MRFLEPSFHGRIAYHLSEAVGINCRKGRTAKRKSRVNGLSSDYDMLNIMKTVINARLKENYIDTLSVRRLQSNKANPIQRKIKQ